MVVQTLRTVFGLERDWLLLLLLLRLGSIHGARLRRSPTWRRSFGDVCLSRSNRDGATSLSNRYRARRVRYGFGSPRSLHLSRRDIILHPFSPFVLSFFLSFFLSSRVLPLLGTSRSFFMRLCDSVWFAERYHGERLAGNVRPIQDGGNPRRSANSAAKVRRTRSRGSSPHG